MDPPSRDQPSPPLLLVARTTVALQNEPEHEAMMTNARDQLPDKAVEEVLGANAIIFGVVGWWVGCGGVGGGGGGGGWGGVVGCDCTRTWATH